MKPASASLALATALLPLVSPVRAQFAPPAGIYALGAAQDNPSTPADERLSGIRNYDFVSGFTLRVLWKDIETSQGVFNFGVIDEAIRRTSANGQRLNLEVLQSLPQYVIDGASATYINHRSEVTPVPWDAFAQSRFAALQAAMSAHVVDDGMGLNLPLSQHPTLRSVDATSVGLPFGLRDLTNTIRSHPEYTQQRFIDSVTQGVGVARSAFPHHQGFLAFFGFNDGQPGVPVDQQLISLLDDQYNGSGQESLAFFIENLSDVGPVPTAGSGGAGNNLLAWSSRGGATMMQALNSWLQPPANQAPQLVSRNPGTGIALGYNTFGTRFFELYVRDLDGAFNGELDATGEPILDDLQYWNSFLSAVAVEPIHVISGTQTQRQAGFPLISGTTPVQKTGVGSVVFDAANTYTGPTSIQQGILAITGSSAIASSSLVSLASGASFDVSALSGGYTVSSGQTIAGSGTVLGSVTFGAGSTLSPGMFSTASGASMLAADMQAGSLQALVVPEPATLGLVGVGLGFLGLGALRRKRVA